MTTYVVMQRQSYVLGVVGGPFILEKASDPFSRKLNKLLPLERFVCIPSEMQTCLPAVARQLFQDIRKVYEETSQSKTRAGKWRRYDRLAV